MRPRCPLNITAETLSAWRDGLLEESEAEEISQHLRTCQACQQQERDFDRIAALLRRQRELDPGTQVWQGVRVRLLQRGVDPTQLYHRRNGPNTRPRFRQERQELMLRIFRTGQRWSARAITLVAAALLVVLVGGLTLGLILVHRTSTTSSVPTAPAPVYVPTPTATFPPPPKCTAPTTLPFPAGDYYPVDASGNFLNPGEGVTPLTLTVDGSFSRSGSSGCYVLTGQQITITEHPNITHSMSDCPTQTPTGVYTWAYANQILSFTLVNDPCRMRSNMLTQDQWKIHPNGPPIAVGFFRTPQCSLSCA
jgi:hypothetical protein